jgi:hypothetical protein
MKFFPGLDGVSQGVYYIRLSLERACPSEGPETGRGQGLTAGAKWFKFKDLSDPAGVREW